MKFKTLRLTGFKSFVEPTEVSIEAGLTGIVGPNGCGKSNLVEALQWVMGENSYKKMRGSGMEDVIFSGSAARPARNAAEVSLTLDNSQRKAPSAFNDADALDVARRIERDMGSSYSINGRDVRARDVQLLFADAAIGAHSAAIVSQGRVGSIIAAKPETRRAILEDAAGIHGLFGRRQEAETRLKAAEQNLERLEDVLAEIERQAESLRRQARQAVRYRTLSAEIRKAEATALVARHRLAAETLEEAGREFAEATNAANELGGEQAAAAKAEAEASAAIPDLREAAASADAAVQRLRIEAERLERERRTAEDQIESLQHRIGQIETDLERERALLTDSTQTLQRLAKDRAGLEQEAATHTEKRGHAASALEDSQQALGESEKLLADASTALADLKARRQQAERTIASLGDRDARLRSELTDVENELATLSAGETDDDVAAAQTKLREVEQDLAAAEKAKTDADERSAEARERDAAARSEASEAKARVGRLEAETEALRSVLPPVAADDPLIASIKPREEGVETALAAVLGEDLDLSDDPSDSAFWRSIDGDSDSALPDGARPLSAMVDAPSVLARRLAQIGLVEPSDGPRLQDQLKPGQTLVSRDGAIWRWDGFCASAEVTRAAVERLSARRRLAGLEADVGAAEQEVADADKACEETTAALTESEQAARAAREARTGARQAVDQARAALTAAERRQSAAGSRVVALRENEARIRRDLDEVASERTAAEEHLAELAQPETLEEPIASLREKVSADREIVAERRSELARIDHDGRTRAALLETVAGEEKAWSGRGDDARRQIESQEARLATSREELAALSGRPAEIGKTLEDLMARSEGSETERNAAADALAVGEQALREASAAVSEVNAALAEARERGIRLEERASGAKERLREIEAKIRETLGASPAEAAEAAGLADKPAPAIEQVEGRVERLRQERERLGGVNLQADQEAEELDTRRQTMISDRDDLIAAINKLRQGIGNLNREGRERMVAAFTQVNEAFQRLFVQLFGGGTAELQLTGSDDPLLAGLEIIARPPGKKPQTMTLLSGGEQALTALALIFAVFLTNPAPICVLDEVDAPLDDANVERFCALLEEITRETGTRFLVITHNPITMARMSRLFGVTMTERGVSQLVSVDLETAERIREAG